ncbi:zinc finger and SCAN domain-containing protein 22-like [Ctenocephalides felis]|uniref:zinc finger and SCAN domain-containing protein 22-like n=1 Tax=Ctenocephalides felis TaxID=7515 RepID=UPI000E6E3829|nr:zinc finger and SCAN domain-containing protein 22-like [Ctenocephalides felis]
MSEETITSMNDQAVKIEPPEYSPEDIKLEIEVDFDDSDVVVKSELCAEDDDTCLERFMNSEVTIEEEVKQELVETSTYECDLCNRSFAESNHLKEHMADHIPNKIKECPFKCKICHKTFSQLGSLKRHMLIHRGERPHECSICNKTFTLLCNLKSHLLIHRGERPYRCSICNKTFTLLSNLKSHMLIHIGARPHECNVCKKAFMRAGDLKKHMLIHNGRHMALHSQKRGEDQ